MTIHTIIRLPGKPRKAKVLTRLNKRLVPPHGMRSFGDRLFDGFHKKAREGRREEASQGRSFSPFSIHFHPSPGALFPLFHPFNNDRQKPSQWVTAYLIDRAELRRVLSLPPPPFLLFSFIYGLLSIP